MATAAADNPSAAALVRVDLVEEQPMGSGRLGRLESVTTHQSAA